MTKLVAGFDAATLSREYAAHVAALQRAYERILAANQLGAVVIHSGSAKARSSFDDQFWSLRPTPHFQHWLPLGEAGCALIVRAGRRPQLIWPKHKDFWEQP